ncbi:MAG: glycosyltransferase [Bacteroidota bacterium]
MTDISNSELLSYPFLSEPIAVTQQQWPDELPPLLSISCITYMHENFIRDAIEGFLMQQTNFKIEILIHDDASTDKTADIVREYENKYPKLIFPTYQVENQYRKNPKTSKNVEQPVRRGKYIAKCEGDDYWIDPLKLQKQVDFLEKNKEYGLVFTDVNILIQETGEFKNAVFHDKILPLRINFTDHLVNRGFLAPCTWLCRREFMPNLKKNYCDGTFPWLLDVFMNSKIYYWDEVTTVYRLLEESASHSKSKKKTYDFRKGVFEIQKDYIIKYNVAEEIKNKIFIETYIHLLEDAILFEDTDFIIEGQKYLQESPSNLMTIINDFYKTKKEYIRLKSDFESVVQSRRYRLGRVVLYPLSYIRSKFKKFNNV